MEGSPCCQFEMVLPEKIFLRRTYLTYLNRIDPENRSFEWGGSTFWYYAAFALDE